MLSVKSLPTFDLMAAEFVISAIMTAEVIAFAVIWSQSDTSLCPREIMMDEASRTAAASIGEKASEERPSLRLSMCTVFGRSEH